MKSQPILGVFLVVSALLLGSGFGVFSDEIITSKFTRVEIVGGPVDHPEKIIPPCPKLETEEVGQTIQMKVTAYCLCEICCGKWSCPESTEGASIRKTSIGDNARIYDGVAADPKLLPYRTKLDIPGIGIKEVDDTGGGMRQSARKGIYHIDVRMPSHSEARRFGVKWLEVKILK